MNTASYPNSTCTNARPATWCPQEQQQLNERFEKHTPQALLRWGVETFADGLVLGTGFGLSGVVLSHMVAQIRPQMTIFYLDTGLLFPETYALRDRLQEKLGVRFTRVHCGLSLEEQAAAHGPDLWRHDPDQCCHLRKVRPLQRFLADKQAWISGLRRDQSSGRAHVKLVAWSSAHRVVKLNPLAAWSEEQIWDYLHAHDLPFNPLHKEGYASVGCVPCTRPVRPGEDPRAGRWSGHEKVECGIHIENGRVKRS